MKLLMITRKVDRNEHLAGFIYNWVKKLAGQVEELRVISWQEGDSADLPDNVKVIHLKTNQNKLLKVVNFKLAVWKNLKYVDGVFCHQMPIYTILAAPLAKLRGNKIVSWYMHRQVDFKMRLMTSFADVILSASEESFRLKTDKLVVTGHGIDTELFSPSLSPSSDVLNIVSVGRVSPTKDYESMIKAVDLLVDQGEKKIKLSIIGQPGLEDQKRYFSVLKEMVVRMDLSEHVKFLGSKPNFEIPKFLQESDLFINMSGTGSIDKAVLEAMSCGCIVLTSNEAFKYILPEKLQAERDNPAMLAEKIKGIISMPTEERDELRDSLRQEVVENHNLDDLVKKIVDQF